MSVKEILDKFRAKDNRFKEMQEQDRAITKVQERKLSAEERALNKLIERDRQTAIKKELSRRHSQETKEYWKKDIISQKNIFKENPRQNVLAGQKLFGGSNTFL